MTEGGTCWFALATTDRAGQVRLRAHWSVVSAADGKALAVDASDIEQPVASSSWPDLVAAHSAALGTMTRQIATRVVALRVR